MGTRAGLIFLALLAAAPASSQEPAPSFDVRSAAVQRVLQKSVTTRVVGIRLVPLKEIQQIPPTRVAAKLTSLRPVSATVPYLIDCTRVLENCLALDREGNHLFSVPRDDARAPEDISGNSSACQANMNSLDLHEVGAEHCRALPASAGPTGAPLL